MALDLQRGCQFTGVFGEIDRQDSELADRLGVRHRQVGLLDGRVDLGHQVGVGGQIAHRRAGRFAVALLPAPESLGIDGDQRADEGLASPTTNA